MSQPRRLLLILIAALSSISLSAQAHSEPPKTAFPLTPELRDGQHDFDFSIGTWQTHISRRLHPLSGSDQWADYVGSSIVRPIWHGRASLGETDADGPAGHLEALSLRLYNPESRQWNLYYASSGGTTSTPAALTVPTIGEFNHGRGEFFDTELFHGRNILVRNVWSDISPQSIRFEQAFSQDGGRTWEVNWIAVDTRVDDAQPSTHAESPGGAGQPLESGWPYLEQLPADLSMYVPPAQPGDLFRRTGSIEQSLDVAIARLDQTRRAFRDRTVDGYDG